MLLKALVVRSTTQKDESLSGTAGRFPKTCALGDERLSLAWNGQEIAVAIEGIVAHGQGGNQGKYLVL